MSDLESWTCPLPLRDSPTVLLGHGAGGRLSAELVEHLFVPAFGGDPDALGDSAVVEVGGARIAMTTDSFVVRPRWFPGGNIGALAVNGTVNDLAMVGAQPMYLTTGFIVEEGMAVDELGRLTAALGAAATEAGVRVVAGDTKVVDRGHGDGVFINTTGVGLVPDGVDIGPTNARPGDAVLVSGPIGLHGVAVLSVRDGLEFGTEIRSDCQPVNGLVAGLLAAGIDVHVLRDPTRGGVAASLNEIAASSRVGVQIEERSIPVPDDVRAACGFLGLDPLVVANEGKLVAFVPAEQAEQALAVLQADPRGQGATRIGTVVAEHPGVVVARTGIGGTRVVDLPLGEQLPRIC
ncbi:MAG: hydrogenase expression/formation protein HypE [Jiangellales bacterium]